MKLVEKQKILRRMNSLLIKMMVYCLYFWT